MLKSSRIDKYAPVFPSSHPATKKKSGILNRYLSASFSILLILFISLFNPSPLFGQTDPSIDLIKRANATIARGFLALESGELESGKMAFEQATSLLQRAGKSSRDIKLFLQNAEREEFEKGRRLVATGEMENAIMAFKSVTVVNPTHAPSYLNLGLIYYRQKGQLDLAIEAFEKAAESRPGMLEPHLFLAQAYTAKGLLIKAEEEAKRTIAINPKSGPGHYVLGFLYEAQGRKADAVLEYKATSSFGTETPEAKKAEERIEKFKKEAEAPFRKGLQALKERKLGKGREAFEAALALDPDMALAYYNLGIIFSQLNQLEKTAASFEEVLQRSPYFFHARLLLGQTYERQGRVAEAILEYQKVLSEVPDPEQLEAIQARQKLSQMGETVKIGEKVAAHLAKGEELSRDRDFDGAEREFLAVLSLIPKQVLAIYRLGQIALKRGDTVTAEDRFLQATQIDPNHFPSLLQLAGIYEGQIPERPFISIIYERGSRYRHLDQVEESISAFNKAKEHRQEKIEKVVEFFKRAAAARPQDKRANLRLGAFYEKVGSYKKAIESYRKVVTLKGQAETPGGRFAKGRINYYEKRFHLTFSDAFLIYDSNRRRSPDPESEISSDLALGLTYDLWKGTRFRIPVQLTLRNTLLHRSQLFFNNDELLVSLITSSPRYTSLLGYRLQYGYSGGTGIKDRSSLVAHTFMGEVARRGKIPTQILFHLNIQKFQALTNPIFDATRRLARLSFDQNLKGMGEDLGRLQLTYTFHDNNVAANDQATRSHALSLKYEKMFSPDVKGNIRLTQTYFRYRHPDSLALSEGEIRRRQNRITTWSIGLLYHPYPGLSFFARYLKEENRSNLPAAVPLDLVSLNSGQATSLGEYQRTLISFGVTLAKDLRVAYPRWAKVGKNLHVALTTGFYRPSLKDLHRVLANPRRVILQDPNHLLPSNPDFRSESRNLVISEIGGNISMGFELEWEISPRHALVFNLSEWQNASVRSDKVPLLLSPTGDPEIVPRSARYNLVVNHLLLTWRYSFWNRPGRGRFYLNLGLIGGAQANLTIDSLVKIEEPSFGRPFASLGSIEARGTGFTTRFGLGGEYFLTSWLSIGLNANYIFGGITKLKVERGFPADFRLIPAALPGITDNPCFRRVDVTTEGETLQVATCEADQIVERSRTENVKIKLDGFEVRGALRFHFGRRAPGETGFERFWKGKLFWGDGKPWLKRAFSQLKINGSLKNETAYRFVEPVSFTKVLNLFRLNTTYPLASRFLLTTRMRAFYDAIYGLVDIDTISPRRFPNTILTQISQNATTEEVAAVQVENSRGADIIRRRLEIRELFLDIHLDRVDLRIGKQIVRWGVVEGSRVTDRLNPFDFSEFILREVEDRFIPLMMVKAEFFPSDYTLELVWIPEIATHKPAPSGSEFEQFEILPGFELPESFLTSSLELNVNRFKNSEVAGRLISSIQGWELSVSAFYTWDDFPSTFRTIEGGVGGGFLEPPTVTFSPELKRLTIIGTTLSKGFGKLVLNSEFAYTFRKFFGTRLEVGDLNQPALLGELQRDFISYALGIDFILFKTDFSFQFLQQRIFNWEKSIIQDRIDTVVAFFARKTILNNRLNSQILILYFTNEDDFLLRPRLGVSLTDHVNLRFGADLFIGDRGEQVGEFDFIGFFKDSNRLYMEMIYSF